MLPRCVYHIVRAMSVIEIEFDGGARPNPGPAAIGCIVESENWREKRSEYIGEATNNEAEYHALIQALELALERDSEHVVAKGDSELVVKQTRGEYDVNSDRLMELNERVQRLSNRLETFSIRYVPREENTSADDLVDSALSGK